MPRLLAFAASACLISAFWWFAAGRPPLVIGDGREYFCTTAGWALDLRPWPSDAAIHHCAAAIDLKAEVVRDGYLHLQGKREGYHFWLLPLLAVPWWIAAEKLGLAAALSYSLFNWSIAVAAAGVLVSRIGALRAAAVLVLVFTSPLIYFTDKAHAEWFIAMALLLAVVEMLSGGWLRCAAWTALAATQQVTLAPVAAMALLVWIWRERRVPRGREWALVSVALGLLALSPVYYLMRWGHPNIIGMLPYFTDTKLVSVHRALSLYIDPDIGLFPNWPLGGGLVLVAAAAGAFQKRLRLNQALWTATVLLAFPLLAGAQTNWNHGGTLHISRYAALLIPVLAAIIVWRLTSVRPAWAGPAVVLAGVLVSAGFNYRTYHPAQGQRYLFHSPLATWLYAHYPNAYDPDEHVWMVRSTGTEQFWTLQGPRMWAVGNQECTKLLLRVDPAAITHDVEQPLGCVATLDRQGLVNGLREGSIRPTRRGYVNLAP